MHKKSPKVSWGHEVVLNSGCDVGYTNQYVSKTHGTIHWKEETLYYMSALKRRKTKIKKKIKRRKEEGKKKSWIGWVLSWEISLQAGYLIKIALRSMWVTSGKDSWENRPACPLKACWGRSGALQQLLSPGNSELVTWVHLPHL